MTTPVWTNGFTYDTIVSSTTDVREDVTNKTDVSLIPFIRESDIDFVGYSLRPNRQSWYYFDDKGMSQFVSRPNIIVLDANKAYGDMLFNTPREEISFVGGRAKVLLAERNQVTGNTTLYISQIRNPRSNVVAGNTVTGVRTTLLANVVSYNHSTGYVRSGSNATNILLGLDASVSNNFYVGNVMTIMTGPCAGYSANITAYNGVTRAATISPALGSPIRVNDIYSIGDSRKTWAVNTTQAHYTTGQGFICGTLHLPNPNANTTYAFRTGDRIIFRIIDNPRNNLLTSEGDKDYTSRADYRYTAFGLKQDETQIINRVITTNTVTVATTVYDPIAQSFFVDGNTYKEGMFVPSIDLYFKNRGENLPIQLQIRPMVEGYPDSETVLPYAETTLLPNQVTTSDLPNVANSLTRTRFTFPSPVYLAPDREYAWVLLTNDYGYDLWVSEVGQTQIGTTRWVSQQPFLGTMFKSQSGRTFTALQNEDAMFVINKCVFNSTGEVVFNEFKNPNTRLPFLANANTYVSNTAFDFFYLNSDAYTLPGTTLDYGYRATSNANNTLNSTYTDFRPKRNTLITDKKVLFGPDAPNSFNCQITLTTTNPDVSPVINYNRQNLIIIQNRINNMGITNAIIAISNTGQSYNGQNSALIFSTSSTGLQANGYFTSNATTGAIESVIIDNPASGYFENVSVTIVSGTGTGGIINVSSELDKSGGPAIARYISKTITLLDGFDAGDIRAFVTAVKPITSNVQVYYKIRNNLDPEPIEDKYWVKMRQVGNEFLYSTNGDPIEYEFRPSLTSNNVTYTSGGATYTTFNQYKIKIVLASSSTLYQDVPFLYDVRAIAMPADAY